MSRAVRMQLFETLESLQKGNQLLENLLHNGKQEEIVNLLTDCQNCAIAIGNQIEAVYGAGKECVHDLENYCESIYQMSENLAIPALCKKLYVQTYNQLQNVKRNMEQEIPDKREVVFLPYKASMWDSLESIWLAARDDEECDDYVIPIPYYDKNPDGSFREEHYEGDEYPEYVPVTRYDEYDFGLRRPDVIYIHNPYDEGNFVTSVHPFFYSKNLKQFTEKLVYVPYFVLEEIDPEDKAAVDGMKHFCLTSGVVNADKVIVQSEKMRQVYVNVMIEYAGENTRSYWENKILGLGSPKVDKVLKTRKEDLEIPNEWLKIIQKSDGSWKKIVFYNTSVSTLLQNNEQMLIKMQDVFQVFKENQNEVALLWRPHPLIKATIESMRPQLWEKYKKIVEQYKVENWGIYDESADLDRAVTLCDAYYGDRSSVVQLCIMAGKAVMIQNVQIIEEQ